jgi:hypothetical protein
LSIHKIVAHPCVNAANGVSLQNFKNGKPPLCSQSITGSEAQKSANMG